MVYPLSLVFVALQNSIPWINLNLTSIGRMVRGVPIVSKEKFRSCTNWVLPVTWNSAILSYVAPDISDSTRYPKIPTSSYVTIPGPLRKEQDSLRVVLTLDATFTMVTIHPFPSPHPPWTLHPTIYSKVSYSRAFTFSQSVAGAAA